MDFVKDGCDIILHQKDFNLDDTLNCGQAFRWQKINSNTYTGAFLNNPLTISCENNDDIFRLKNTTYEDMENLWLDYFDLSVDYSQIKKQLSEDETLAKACSYAGGIRILKQDKWETLSSFIISQNNNIPRIKSIISRLTDNFNGYPSYKDMAALSVRDLDFLRCGFRAKYLSDAAAKINSGEIDLDEISQMDMPNARASLQKIKGVGPKVAECTLLFGYHKTQAFPIDVWIKRIMENFYPNGLPQCTQGIEGIAQQYLFHYIRTAGIAFD